MYGIILQINYSTEDLVSDFPPLYFHLTCRFYILGLFMPILFFLVKLNKYWTFYWASKNYKSWYSCNRLHSWYWYSKSTSARLLVKTQDWSRFENRLHMITCTRTSSCILLLWRQHDDGSFSLKVFTLSWSLLLLSLFFHTKKKWKK